MSAIHSINSEGMIIDTRCLDADQLTVKVFETPS